MKDMLDQLGLTARAVGTDTLPAGDAWVVTLTRTYAADVEDVWGAITDPKRIARWFLPVSGDLRLGGTYQLEGHAGGEIRVCDRPRRLLLTWVMGAPPSDEDSSLVDVALDPDRDGTRLRLTHSAVVPAQMWDNFGPGAVGVGWDSIVLGLGLHLAGEDIGDPAELEQSPEMRAYMTASSQSWGTAYRASGADAEVVERTTAATTAFYVPPPES
jgi:uncharacterized protein YndB with AHSA1/START domain